MRSIIVLMVLVSGCAKQSPTRVDEVPSPQPDPIIWTTPRVTAPGVQYHTFFSDTAKAEVSFHIWLPPSYEESEPKRYPVLYYLHGSNGQTIGIGPISSFFAQAMEAGKLEERLIVFGNSLANGMWVNSKDGRTPIETLFIEELVPHVDATFRTIAERNGRILEGFSMGGYGTGRLGIKYNSMFSAISMLGAGPVQPNFFEGPGVPLAQRQIVFRAVYGEDMDFFYRQSPWHLAEVHATELQSGMRVRILVGDADAMVVANRNLTQRFNELGIPHEYKEAVGVGHQAIPLLTYFGEDLWPFYGE